MVQLKMLNVDTMESLLIKLVSFFFILPASILQGCFHMWCQTGRWCICWHKSTYVTEGNLL